MASSSSSPCAACKFLRRKCTQGCVFAPYFPPDQPQKFSNVHRVFGASNVAKILNEISPAHREDAVNSLAYEAEARLRDPVYGCVGYISMLQHKLKQVQYDLFNAKKELSSYIGPTAMSPFIAHPHHALMNPHHHHHGNPLAMIREQQQQQLQLMEAQQMAMAAAAAAREQELLRSYEQQHEFARYNSSSFEGGSGVVGPGLNPMDDSGPDYNSLHVQYHQHQQHQQHQHHQQQLQLHHHHERGGSDEGRSGVGPSS